MSDYPNPWPLQAITTKQLGPTDHRDKRVKATAKGGTATVTWDYDLEVAQNHAAAAKALTKKLNWRADYHMGGTPDGYVFVIADKSSKAW
tara:strand:+ start:2899 stop:3168 length:270 start_codon:yes stop_codon:yes gene_type:complete